KRVPGLRSELDVDARRRRSVPRSPELRLTDDNSDLSVRDQLATAPQNAAQGVHGRHHLIAVYDALSATRARCSRAPAARKPKRVCAKTFVQEPVQLFDPVTFAAHRRQHLPTFASLRRARSVLLQPSGIEKDTIIGADTTQRDSKAAFVAVV